MDKAKGMKKYNRCCNSKSKSKKGKSRNPVSVGHHRKSKRNVKGMPTY